MITPEEFNELMNKPKTLRLTSEQKEKLRDELIDLLKRYPSGPLEIGLRGMVGTYMLVCTEQQMQDLLMKAMFHLAECTGFKPEDVGMKTPDKFKFSNPLGENSYQGLRREVGDDHFSM